MNPFKVRVFGGKSGLGTARVEIDPEINRDQTFLLREKLRKAGFKPLPDKPFQCERWEKIAVFNPNPDQGYTRKYVKEEYEKYLDGLETEGIVI